jgi:Tol biopolymer transport system component
MRRFATQGGIPFRIALSPDGKSLVYRQRIKGKDSLWLGAIDSNTSVQISDRNDIFYSAITYAPDGQSLYLTVRDDKRAHNLLMRMAVIGGVLTELHEDLTGPVTFAPDGKHLAFLRLGGDGKETSIIITDVDGRDERRVATSHWPNLFSTEGPSWSPDGKSIVVGMDNGNAAHGQITAVSVADGSLSRIGSRDWNSIGNIGWLRDGSGLILTCRENTVARRSQIWFVPFPAGEPHKIINDLDFYRTEHLSISNNGTLAVLKAINSSEIWVAPGGDVKHAQQVLPGLIPRFEGVDGLAWTPDGHLLYSVYVGDSQTIWQIKSDGKDARQLTVNAPDVVDRHVGVTADGRYMVFHSNRSGAFQIWRANLDGSDLKQLTTTDINYQPCLAPDNSTIVYTSGHNGSETIWRISIDGSNPEQLTQTKSSHPEVSPDGKSIAFLDFFDANRYQIAIMPFEGGEPTRRFKVPDTVVLARLIRWTPDGKALIYQDTLRGLWKQRLDQEKPEHLAGFEDMQVPQLAWSFDKKNLAYTRAPDMQEIILLDSHK